MEKLFFEYENCGGYKSLIRFLKFSERKFSKTNYNKLMKKYEKFEKDLLEKNDYQIRKDYYNFRNYCLQ